MDRQTSQTAWCDQHSLDQGSQLEEEVVVEEQVDSGGQAQRKWNLVRERARQPEGALRQPALCEKRSGRVILTFSPPDGSLTELLVGPNMLNVSFGAWAIGLVSQAGLGFNRGLL